MPHVGTASASPTAAPRLGPWCAGGDHPVVVGEHDRRGPVADAELAEDAADVRLHGRLGDVQACRDLAVRRPARDQPQDVALTLGQELEPRRPRALAGATWRR